MSHRLFFGIRPPLAIRAKLLDLMVGIDNARWQDDDQLHLTLRYIGEIETHRADDIAEAAQAIRFEPFELHIAGCGFFERKGVPRIAYATIAPCETLVRLHRKIDRICTKAGAEPLDHPFVPHITLARLNSSSGPVGPFLARNVDVALGPWTVEEYVLYESTLREEGSLYEPVFTYTAIGK